MIAVAFITILLVAGVVALQVKALLLISEYLPRFPFRPLFKVSAGLIGVIAAHVASIVLFGTAIFLLAKTNPEKFGRLEGLGSQTIHDFIYFSFTTYITVVYGDYIPVGPIRLISQIEALVGLVLIACSASYIFIIMQDYWKKHARRLRVAKPPTTPEKPRRKNAL